MRVIETKVFTFDELNKEAKEKAIESIRETYYNFNEFAEWSVDDCWLFNPIQDEVKDFDLKDGILIGNNRKDIYFSTDRNWFLDCAKAMEVKDEDCFFKWLGLPKEMGNIVEYEIYTPQHRNADTEIYFTHVDSKDFTDDEENYLGQAINKFSTHVDNCLKSIQESREYRYTDESIKEDIEANEYEFIENGTQY